MMMVWIFCVKVVTKHVKLAHLLAFHSAYLAIRHLNLEIKFRTVAIVKKNITMYLAAAKILYVNHAITAATIVLQTQLIVVQVVIR